MICPGVASGYRRALWIPYSKFCIYPGRGSEPSPDCQGLCQSPTGCTRERQHLDIHSWAWPAASAGPVQPAARGPGAPLPRSGLGRGHSPAAARPLQVSAATDEARPGLLCACAPVPAPRPFPARARLGPAPLGHHLGGRFQSRDPPPAPETAPAWARTSAPR